MSAELIEQYRVLHSQNEGYGSGDKRLVEFYKEALDGRANIKSIADYGCGKSPLLDLLNINAEKFWYDPAIPEKSIKFWEKEDFDRKVDLVICNDVLEHIPESELIEVLTDIDVLGQSVFFTIHCAAARTVLPNGQNAHATVRPKEWWIKKLEKFWGNVVVMREFGSKFIVLCSNGG